MRKGTHYPKMPPYLKGETPVVARLRARRSRTGNLVLMAEEVDALLFLVKASQEHRAARRTIPYYEHLAEKACTTLDKALADLEAL
jgi:hypothetical protein